MDAEAHNPIADAKAQEATHHFTFRHATTEDIPALQKMIEESLRALGKGYYTQAELDGSIGFLFGPDTLLLHVRSIVLSLHSWHAYGTKIPAGPHILYPSSTLFPKHNLRMRRLVLPPHTLRRRYSARPYARSARSES